MPLWLVSITMPLSKITVWPWIFLVPSFLHLNKRNCPRKKKWLCPKKLWNLRLEYGTSTARFSLGGAFKPPCGMVWHMYGTCSGMAHLKRWLDRTLSFIMEVPSWFNDIRPSKITLFPWLIFIYTWMCYACRCNNKTDQANPSWFPPWGIYYQLKLDEVWKNRELMQIQAWP